MIVIFQSYSNTFFSDDQLWLSCRGNMGKVNNDLSPMGRLPGLESEVDKLQALMDSLIFIYKDEKDAMEKSISANNAG